MVERRTLAIVGASHAGVALAAAARSQGFDGNIVLIGDEPELPYQRPPLSKGLLLGKVAPEQLQLRGPSFWRDQQIELEIGRRVNQIDVASKNLVCEDARTLSWDYLALATGARCRTLPLPSPAGVHYLRSKSDAIALNDAMRRASSAVVVGGGFIGLEVAAALRQAGAQVTVVESQPRLLTRSMPASLASALQRHHESFGVRFVKGQTVSALLSASDGALCAVQLSDGRRLEADIALIGVGVVPNVELATAAGLAVADGILVDAAGRTSAPNVWAVGDVAAGCHPFAVDAKTPIRLESLQAANDGAFGVAADILSKPIPPTQVPTFWTEQWGWRIQMSGLYAPIDEIVVRGSIDDGSSSLFALREGRVSAVFAINRPAEAVAARRLIAGRSTASAEQLSDPDLDLRSLVSAGA